MIPFRAKGALRLDSSLFDELSAADREVLDELTFRRMIALERKRTERSREPFLLMLLENANQQDPESSGKVLDCATSALQSSSRETDIVGWYKASTIVGVMFTGLSAGNEELTLEAVASRVKSTLKGSLISDQLNQISISFHFFPDDWDQTNAGWPSDPALYLDLIVPGKRKRFLLVLKRLIDIFGSTLTLILCSPLLMAIACAIKVSSKGPVFFRQQRVGQYGKHFSFLKFRSMFVNNDHFVHQKYVTELIAGGARFKPLGSDGGAVYKLKDDKRITGVGRLLRRTSLDELPQLLNVLKGEMSLVGPRPAIPYELAAYQTWHRRRVLEAKPGMTGVWQVAGRSRVKFDEMVRMDLRYAMAWSPWLDLKILMRTPLAVIRGNGAY